MDAGTSRPGPYQSLQFHMSTACPSVMYPHHRLPMSPNSKHAPHMHDSLPCFWTSAHPPPMDAGTSRGILSIYVYTSFIHAI
eukprot:1192831-Prorocentrum_minimum.AAC.1